MITVSKMAAVLGGKPRSIDSLPENILLLVFSHLPVKDLCTMGRVCRVWRRVTNDNSLWRHVDLSQYKINLNKMWKVIRAHFSSVLLSLRLRGYMDPTSINWKKSSLSDAMLKDLQDRCPNIKVLEITHTNLTDLSLDYLPMKLETLSIQSSLLPTSQFSVIHTKNLLPDLRHLDLSNSSKTNNSAFRDLASCKKLESLRINGCYRVTEEGLQIIAENFSNLKVLEISETACTDLSLHHICRHLKSLTLLNLSRSNKFTAAGLGNIATLPNLKTLNLSSCKNITKDDVENFHIMIDKRSVNVILEER